MSEQLNQADFGELSRAAEPIRYAVVGLGRAGWDIHLNQLRGRADAKVVAVVDPVTERRDQAAAEFACKTFDSLAKMLRQSDPEVVVIATPSAQHAADAKKCFRAGKHVAAEKPMAVSLAEAQKMIAAANDAGLKLFVHHNYRFFHEFIHMKETIDSGLLGRVFHIRNYITNFARRNDWQTLAKNGGGLLNNWGAHFIDQILQLIGSKVTQAMGDLKQIASAGDVEDHVKAFLRFDNGATADIEISNAENVAITLPKWIVCGTHGTLTCDGVRSIVRWFDPAQVQPLTVDEGPARDRKYGNDDRLPWQEKTIEVGPRPRGAFYDNIYGVLRRGEPMYITPESAAEVMRVIALIRRGTAFPGKPAREEDNNDKSDAPNRVVQKIS